MQLMLTLSLCYALVITPCSLIFYALYIGICPLPSTVCGREPEDTCANDAECAPRQKCCVPHQCRPSVTTCIDAILPSGEYCSKGCD